MVSVTTSPQRRAFSPSLYRHKRDRNNKKKKKEKDRCGRERHRRRRRATCCETVDDAFNVTRHSFAVQSEWSSPTLAHKYTVTHPHEVSCAMFSWSLGVERSAPRHVRDNHRCLGQVRNQPVVMFLRSDGIQCLCRAGMDCWPASTLGAWVSDGPHPGGYAGVRLGEARHQGLAEYEGESGLHHSCNPIRAACGYPNDVTRTCDIAVAPQCEESKRCDDQGVRQHLTSLLLPLFFVPSLNVPSHFHHPTRACMSHLVESDERVLACFFFQKKKKKLRRVWLLFRAK